MPFLRHQTGGWYFMCIKLVEQTLKAACKHIFLVNKKLKMIVLLIP